MLVKVGCMDDSGDEAPYFICDRVLVTGWPNHALGRTNQHLDGLCGHITNAMSGLYVVAVANSGKKRHV
jgi:hypothetical protein